MWCIAAIIIVYLYITTEDSIAFSFPRFFFFVYHEQHQSLNIYGRDRFKRYFSFPPNHFYYEML